MKGSRPAGGYPSSGTFDYILCGWRVQSELSLPELLPWTGDERSPDVTLRFDTVPDLPDPVGRGGPVCVAQSGACRLEFKNGGRFLIVGGRDVIVEPWGAADSRQLHALLLGPVLGVLAHQRNLFPLHAACVRIAGGAIAFAGRAGAGKSTLAAALARRGHLLVADDVCVVDLTSGRPLVMASFPRLKLWDDSIEALGLCTTGIPRAGRGKFHFHQPGNFSPSPVELIGVYLLDRSPAASQVIMPEYGAAAAAMLSKEIYRPRIGFWLGRKTALLTAALHLATTVPAFRIALRPDLAGLGTLAERVEAHALSLGRDRPARARAGGDVVC